jgi:hypothetical protein
MKEHPILFSGQMVRAILDGTKTQTRRVVKPQPVQVRISDEGCNVPMCLPPRQAFHMKFPYGMIGDRLWVRETWMPYYGLPGNITYRADYRGNYVQEHRWPDKWHPSIFMPRWASRITLEVLDIRVQRVQEISERDAEAEGISRVDLGTDERGRPVNKMILFRLHFSVLWNSINAKRGYAWEVNPWVWAITFRRIES